MAAWSRAIAAKYRRLGAADAVLLASRRRFFQTILQWRFVVDCPT
jgi:hypothetical protein